ncbi:MAG: phosphatase PAP2 family protein, partial [Thermomicrobiales bacterium]
RRIGAMLGGVIVALITLTIVAAGNHYLIDVVGGWIVVATSFAAARVLPRRAVDRQADGVRDRERRSLRSIGDRR